MTETQRSANRSRSVILAGCLVAGLVCYGLAIWQLQRLAQRRSRNALTVERMAQAPIDLVVAMASTEDQAYRMVRGRGAFDPNYAVYIANRSHDELPGMHVVAPLHVEESGVGILVNLGWVQIEAAEANPPSTWLPERIVDVVGVLRASQTEPRFTWLADPTAAPGAPPRERWRVLSISGIQTEVPTALSPYYLALMEPVSRESAPLPAPEVDLSEGPHLSYAIQWFAFGTTAIVGGVAWARAARRREDP